VFNGALKIDILSPENTPVETLCVALKSRQAPAAWDMLCALAGVAVPRPGAPWIGVAHLGTCVPEWLWDFERCVGVAWAEKKQGHLR
jgi:hypothetical protein